MQCIDDSSVKFRQTDEDLDTILKRISSKRLEELNEIVKIIDSSSFTVEQLYSYNKFIEILDRHGFAAFVN